MITQYNIFEMLGKKTKFDIIRFNEIYSNKPITIKVLRRINRQVKFQEESFIIDKIGYKLPDIYDRVKRSDAIVISLKGRCKRNIIITKDTVTFDEEFERPYEISHFDDTLQTIIDIFRNL